ncbi:MAG: hypothetical protein ACD_60C00087G0013 [uncultured bacterium]|nr:MAG: hypothetical protein ACD_60C00087G0013 [uncultured bacterium]
MPIVIVPEALVRYTSGKKRLDFDLSNGQSFASFLKKKQPQLYQVLFDCYDQLNGYIAIYKNNNQIDISDNNCTFSQNDTLEIVVPISGG